MFLNMRQKPQELIYYQALSNRSVLSNKEQRKLAALSAGHAGECEYDRLFDAAGHGSLLIYRDVWMKVDEAVIQTEDRKSTRLNSSHVATSYAVFCLKKKTNR